MLKESANLLSCWRIPVTKTSLDPGFMRSISMSEFDTACTTGPSESSPMAYISKQYYELRCSHMSHSIDVKCYTSNIQGDLGPTDLHMVSYQLFSTSDDTDLPPKKTEEKGKNIIEVWHLLKLEGTFSCWVVGFYMKAGVVTHSLQNNSLEPRFMSPG